jgi:phenylalanyl-tRNA synthetase beta chain
VQFTQLPDDSAPTPNPAASAQILLDGEPVGIIGEVHPQVLAAYELRQAGVHFRNGLQRLIPHIPESRTSYPLPKFPSVSRDATLILANEVETGALLDYIRQMDEPLIEEVRLFDVFTGRPIAEGAKAYLCESFTVRRNHAGRRRRQPDP